MAAAVPGGEAADGRPRGGAPPAGQAAGFGRASRAEPVGHMREVGAMGKGRGEGGGSVQGVFYPLRDHPGLLSVSPSAFLPGIDRMRLEMVGM